MIYCSNCGTSNRDGSRFCNECGSRLGTYIPCQSCNSPNLSTARFCNNCGAAVSAGTEPDSPEAEAPLGLPILDDEEGELESEVPSQYQAPSQPTETFERGILEDDEAAAFETPTAAANFTLDETSAFEPVSAAAMSDDEEASSAGANTISDDMLSQLLALNEGDNQSSIVVDPEDLVGGTNGDNGSVANALPLWMLEDDSAELTEEVARAGSDIDNRDAFWGHSGESATSRSDEGLLLATSMSSDTTPRRIDSERTTAASLDGAGASFASALAQPWQPFSTSTEVNGEPASSENREEVKVEQRRIDKRSYVIIGMGILAVAATAFYVFVANPELVRPLNEGLAAPIQATITEMLNSIGLQ